MRCQADGANVSWPIHDIASQTNTNAGSFQLTILSIRLSHNRQRQYPIKSCVLSLNACHQAQPFGVGSDLGGYNRVHCCRYCDHFEICWGTSWQCPWSILDFQASDRRFTNSQYVLRHISVDAWGKKRFRSSPVTIQMDAGTILCDQFVNYVVRCCDLRPLLFHTEFNNLFV